MTLERKSPMWPFLSVLACLFALSLAAPRSWERIARRPKSDREESAAPQHPPKVAQAANSVVRSQAADPAPRLAEPSNQTPTLAKAPEQAATPARPSDWTPTLAQPIERAPAGDRAARKTAQAPSPKPQRVEPPVRVDSSTDRLAMLSRRPASQTELQFPSINPQLPSILNQPLIEDTPPAASPEAVEKELELLDPRNEIEEVKEDEAEEVNETSGQPSPSDLADQPPPDWSVATALLTLCDELASSPSTEAWATATSDQLRRLADNPTIESAEVSEVFERLRTLASQAAELAPTLDPPAQIGLQRAEQALTRRLDVCELVHNIRTQSIAVTVPTAEDRSLLSQRLAEVKTLLDTHEQGKAWNQYLLVDEIEALADKDATPDALQDRALARRLLLRLRDRRLSSDQHRFVSGSPVAALADALRVWTAEPVDTAQLLANVERFEQSHSAADAQPLAEDCRKLAWSAAPEYQELGRQLERHYRGANLRLTLSAELINRFMPEREQVNKPVVDTILGADVEGDSVITTKLSVRLLPDDERFRIGLEVHGQVVSDTAATSGPATFYSEGQTDFIARKMVQVTRRGVLVWPAIANADGESSLTDVATTYDNFPLLGAMVRNVATSKHAASEYEAMLEVEGKVADQAREQLDAEANRRITEYEEKFKQRLFSPVARLDLNPTPLSLATTPQHMEAHLRLAGDQQLAAPAPTTAPSTESHLNIQLHLSALNNAVDQLGLGGRQIALPELYQIVAEKLGQSNFVVPADIPSNVKIKSLFTQPRPQADSGDAGRLKITLKIDELKVRRSKYENLTVRAYYRPSISGLQADLVRDGSIQVESPRRLRAKGVFVVRGVFAKVFQRNKPLPLLDERFSEDHRLAGLEVTQLELRDDWISLSIGGSATEAEQVANRSE